MRKDRPLSKILHIDMDAFFASVEQRDQPALRGRPVVVGGPPNSRGVVCAASYEARVFGVKSAMSCAEAYRRCPQAVFVPPAFERYRQVSDALQEIFRRYTPLIEPLSLDEAYLDVTEDLAGLGSATQTAVAIREVIRAELRLTASAGVASNKFLAKVASDQNKPDGLCVIRPEAVASFLARLPVGRVPGVGAVTKERCERLGIHVCTDFLRFELSELTAHFGRAGAQLHALARGEDDRKVVVDRVRKSVGIEDTFATDLRGAAEGETEILRLVQGLCGRAEAAGVFGRCLTLKVKTDDFRVHTRRLSKEDPFEAREDLEESALQLLRESLPWARPVRLLGLQLSLLADRAGARQMLLPFA